MLIQRGDSVCSFSRSIYPELKALGVESFQGDLTDREAVPRAESCDVVFHVAARAGIWGRYEEYYARTWWAPRTSWTCRRWRIRKLVYTSSPSVVSTAATWKAWTNQYPTPSISTPITRNQGIAETKVLKANGTDGHVALRPHLIWGPGGHHLIRAFWPVLAPADCAVSASRQADRLHLHRQRRRGTSSGRRPPSARLKRCRQSLLRLAGRAAAAVGSYQSHPPGGGVAARYEKCSRVACIRNRRSV